MTPIRQDAGFDFSFGRATFQKSKLIRYTHGNGRSTRYNLRVEYEAGNARYLSRLEIVAERSCSHNSEVDKKVDQHLLQLQRSGLIR